MSAAPLIHPSESKRIAHWPELDGARGLAVLMVLLDHASDAGMRLFEAAALNRLGKFGVYLFFVLSAFLLTYQFYVRRREEFLDARTWWNYAVRRFLRIFPVYAVVVCTYVLMDEIEPRDIATHLLLRDGKDAFWTIPVEVKFYFLLPFIVLALFWAGRKHWLWGLIASVGAVIAGAVLCTLEEPWSLQENVLLAPNLAAFGFGVLAAIAYGRLHALDLTRWRPWLDAAAAVALVAVVLRVPAIYNAIFSSHDPVSKLAGDVPICGALWAVFLLGITLGKGVMSRAMSWAPLRYLGLISFSAYLWHVKFVADFDDMPLPPVLRLVVFLAVVIAIASVSYFLFERPLLKLRPRRAPESAPASAAG